MVVGGLMVAWSLFSAGETTEHKGSGVVMFGGDQESQGTSGDEFSELVPESQYKRERFTGEIATLLAGVIIFGYGFAGKRETEE